MKDKPEIAAIAVIVVGVGLIAGLVVNEQRKPNGPPAVLGERFTQSQTPLAFATDPIPTLTVSIPPLPVPTATVTQTVTATPTSQATSSPRSTTATTTRAAGVALYDIAGSCSAQTTRADGTKVPSTSTWARHRLLAGDKFTYTFSFDSGREASVTRACTFRTTQVTSGSESPLRILLRCNGESGYSSTPPDPRTSAISKTWRPSQLTDGFTHRMHAPRQSQTSEKTTCTVDVVRV